MAQPTQAYPPWLTPSLSVSTNADGIPVATSTSIVYLPLTYFGPSIPLGSLWTFGGSTSPASTTVASTQLTTTATPFTITTTTAAPTITFSSTPASISTSNTATPISSTSLLSSASSTRLSSSSSIPSPSSSSTPSSTPPPAQLSALTKGQLVGVIVASILGLIFVFVFALFLFLWWKGRKNRRQFTTLVPIDEDGDYDVLSASDVQGYRPVGDSYGAADGYRVPGEGSPRHSGDEASSFLRQSRGGDPSLPQTSAAGLAASGAMSQVPTGTSVSHAIPRIPPPTTNSNSSGSRSSNSNASGFGVLIERPSQGLGYLPSMPEHPHNTGTILDQEDVLPDDPDMYNEHGEYTGAYAYAADSLLAPPRLLDPHSSPVYPYFPSAPSRLSDLSEAEVLTAERRTISSLVGSQPPELPELPEFSDELSPRASGGLLGAIGLGLGGLANLGRRSWFKSPPRHSPDFTIEPFTEKDLETGRAMLSPDSMVHNVGSRRGGVGAGPDGTRPKSSSSARSGTSGGTIYHDAHSSTPSTPLLPPLPRAVTPAAAASGEQPLTETQWLSSPLSRLPAYHDEDVAESPGFTDSLNLHLNLPPGSDILDMPAPVALPHFASVSSLKETTTGSSLGLKFPPGLDTIRPIGWSDVATEVTASSSRAESPFGGIFLNNSLTGSDRATIDLLEDAPPGAELGWRSMASAGFGDAGRRGTFGVFIDQTGFMSEQGSLHSMRSHINPSVRSTGSAPASRRDGSSSMGSASSRPSAHSLARTGSISSSGRRHHSNSPTLSLSAFGGGYSQMRSSPLAAVNNNHHHNNRPTPPALGDPLLSSISPATIIGSPPPRAHISPDKTSSTTRSLGSTTTVMDNGTVRGAPGMGLVRSRSTSPLSASFPLNAPWAAGLDNDWTPAA